MKRTYIVTIFLLACSSMAQGATKPMVVSGLHFQEDENIPPYSFYYPYDYRYYYPDTYGKSSDGYQLEPGRCFAPKVAE